MSREVHVQFCERAGVRFPCATHLILGFENQEDAEKVYAVLFRRFEKYGLKLHPEKTRLVPFGRPRSRAGNSGGEGTPPGTFDFLGFTHYWGKSRNGRWVIRRHTSRKRFTRSLKAMNQWCRKNLHEPMRVQVEALGRKLKGHFGYYGITGNYEALARYRREVIRVWRKWLARRGDPQGMSWERMTPPAPVLLPARSARRSFRLCSETVTRGTVCGKSARTGLWGCRRVTAGTTRQLFGR